MEMFLGWVLSDLTQVSWLAFNMTICGTTPAVGGPYPAISSPVLQALYHLAVSKWLLLCGANERGGQTRRKTTGRTNLSFPPLHNTIQHQSSSTMHPQCNGSGGVRGIQFKAEPFSTMAANDDVLHNTLFSISIPFCLFLISLNLDVMQQLTMLC